MAAFFFGAGCSDHDESKGLRGPTPVEVADVERGVIRSIRVFSGTLEARATFIVSPKVGGRIETMLVDIGDKVARGDMLATLDDAEYRQDLAQAEAEYLVAEANADQAKSALTIAKRAMDRAETLRKRGVSSDAELDLAKSELSIKEAEMSVYEAQLNRAAAELESAKIRLGYTEVRALWSGVGSERFVAERYIDEGQTVAANTALLQIVDVASLSGVFYVTERDYVNLEVGQSVELRTDAYADKVFSAEIARIAPIFQEGSRQARVELSVGNEAGMLKPGMFIRANVVLRKVDDAVIVPEFAVIRRSDVTGVFVVGPDAATAIWKPLQVGIREAGRVEVFGDGIEGRVVTLGQQLIDDGGAIKIAELSQ